MALLNYLKSTILSKIIMAVSGILLMLYVVVHTAGNMLIFLGMDAINSYSGFLHSLGPALWLIRAGLILAAVLHVITSVYLKFHNLGAKPQKYAVKNYVKAKLTSRTMIWTGSMVFCFVLYHLLHFTIRVTNPQHYTAEFYKPVHAVGDLLFERLNVYAMIVLGFRNPLISITYMIAVIIVGFHLNHAIQSMFQTLGFNQKNYFSCLEKTGTYLSVIITLCLISIPISVLFGLVGGGV